mmetsp:Transcript_438/g.695  ORF Transcript_438/g.695 Transcript_438/m.695 type:complete len:181 (+) Transcript_438:116-658(+)|eukprot:CAMPEP_0184860836 /NCGR_PEP_ID=MMETSP0580-20130426/5646_1 /TAXON_ID=1118495 /ORGANISM="Dactyliosolen fragilissimus" /LENGTH=180 /DNA_ID=CAMNT_0027358091 /DNA_START=58 /DNA_END=600 /DNA_ORIENTATION=-
MSSGNGVPWSFNLRNRNILTPPMVVPSDDASGASPQATATHQPIQNSPIANQQNDIVSKASQPQQPTITSNLAETNTATGINVNESFTTENIYTYQDICYQNSKPTRDEDLTQISDHLQPSEITNQTASGNQLDMLTTSLDDLAMRVLTLDEHQHSNATFQTDTTKRIHNLEQSTTKYFN